MKILVVRLSSLGDILHLFPAISDLRRQFPDAEIHWLIEPAFAEIASWHSAVDKVITVPLRSYKKKWSKVPALLLDLRRQLHAEKYDLILDAQGLLKSALLASMAGTEIHGFHADSAREPLAARFYRKTALIPAGLHVIDKNRQLIAKLFGANINLPADFGLDNFCRDQMTKPLPEIIQTLNGKKYFVLLHGTTWNSKYWPESSWVELVSLLTKQGLNCLVPWGNEEERQRAQRLQLAGGELAHVLPRLPLSELMLVLLHAQAFVSVESGIGHIAAVLNIPGIMLHGPTDPDYSGIPDKSCLHLTSGLNCAPCFKRDCPRLELPSDTPPCQQAITVQRVFQLCMQLNSSTNTVDMHTNC